MYNIYIYIYIYIYVYIYSETALRGHREEYITHRTGMMVKKSKNLKSPFISHYKAWSYKKKKHKKINAYT